MHKSYLGWPLLSPFSWAIQMATTKENQDMLDVHPLAAITISPFEGSSARASPSVESVAPGTFWRYYVVANPAHEDRSRDRISTYFHAVCTYACNGPIT